ncbi:MAG TPA: V-type ATP synthase subunit A [Pseudolabrys sp.]|nr:V-type ATP synthase subunit A [Pseudolabrys sp.]
MSEATIRWVGGPVLYARVAGDFRVGEALEVGAARRPGEVIRLKGDELVGQVYEDTTGLKPGDAIRGTGAALSVRLGPGLLGRIFDGLLRPLDAQPGRQFAFRPLIKVGDILTPGMAIGELPGDGIRQRILCPPDLGGTVDGIVAEGTHPADAALCTVKAVNGESRTIGFFHRWPIRQARPVTQRLPADAPMITGQRILDTLFPVARGGQAAIPGGFGTGKTVLQETLAKWCDADVIVYVGCGERGNEMAEVLREFPHLSDPRSGRGLMERTLIIANTSNMPVAAREASIYTAVTVGEYFRDQGLHVALMADSTSRWAEALREVSGRLGELPGEAAYPAYLGSRLAEFYERAAKVTTLGGAQGSLTIIGAVSPPAGDFSEPVTSHTRRYVRCFWGLDRERAQARFYPAIHPLQSYSENAVRFAAWWTERGNPDWHAHREKLLSLLEQQADLERMARIVGKDALPPAQQLTLLCAELINEAFLRQSAFSQVDRYCSPQRQMAMLGLILHFITLAETALANGIAPQKIAELPVLRRLQRMGEEIGENALDKFPALRAALDGALADLARGTPHAA